MNILDTTIYQTISGLCLEQKIEHIKCIYHKYLFSYSPTSMTLIVRHNKRLTRIGLNNISIQLSMQFFIVA